MAMRIALTAVLLVTALHAAASGLSDITRSMRERAWEAEHIPESGDSIPPLTEYDEFEVIELFRAETIEELEAALPETYPMPWLEETLKDTGIPWEDRYWLDRRVRAAISQNLHVFYDTEGKPVHVDADGIFPGEFYWREHMIVDPAGWNVPEDMVRPTPSDQCALDIGYLTNSFGRRIGKIQVAVQGISLSRDASIGLIITGRTNEYPNSAQQLYACFLYPDGSFEEVPFDTLGVFRGSMSADGDVFVFFRHSTSREQASHVEVWDRYGNVLKRIPSEVEFEMITSPQVSPDGRYAACTLLDPPYRCAIVNCLHGQVVHVTEHTGTDLTTSLFNFSPDGDFISVGGIAKGRVIDLEEETVSVYQETAREQDSSDITQASCSEGEYVTAVTTTRVARNSSPELEIRVFIKNELVHSSKTSGVVPLITETSPHGCYLLSNPGRTQHGTTNSIPFVVMRVSGR